MEAGVVELKNKGMFRDPSISKSVNEFAFYNKNIRISSVDNDNTLLSVTNEKGPAIENIVFTYEKALNKVSYDKNSNRVYLEHSIRNGDSPVKIKYDYSVDEPKVTVNIYNYINENNYILFGGRKFYFAGICDFIMYNGSEVWNKRSLWITKGDDYIQELYNVLAVKAGSSEYPSFNDIINNRQLSLDVYAGVSGDIKIQIPETRIVNRFSYVETSTILNGFIYGDIELPILNYEFDHEYLYSGVKDYIFKEKNGLVNDELSIHIEHGDFPTKFPYMPDNLSGYPEFLINNENINNKVVSIDVLYDDGVIINNPTSNYYSLIDLPDGTNRARSKELIISYPENQIAVNTSHEPTSMSIVDGYEENERFLFYIDGDNAPEQTEHQLSVINGSYLGHCILNDYVVLFTHSDSQELDFIYRLDFSDKNNISGKLLFSGNLGFNMNNPIETLACYESENIQKVYWVDGENQPRVINIVDKSTYGFSETAFDFCSGVNRIPDVTIEKEYNGNGIFNSGTIQYYITYYKKFGQESHIVYSSPLYYISAIDRGLKADETSTCDFKLTISNVDKENFDYIRIYSAKRSSINGPLSLQIVGDYEVGQNKDITIIDNNVNQEAVDPNMLYFIGGKEFVAGTIDQKNDTAFFGDLSLKKTTINENLQQLIRDRINTSGSYYESQDIIFDEKRQEAPSASGYYSYKNNLNLSDAEFKTYKYGEYYRFAIQFITNTGESLQPIWIGDKYCNIRPRYDEENNCFYVPNAKFIWYDELNQYTENYIGYKLLIAETSASTRQIVAQGIVNPTMFNYLERFTNSPYSIASWNFRPKHGDIPSGHLYPLNKYTEDNAELQGLKDIKLPFFNDLIYNETHYKYRLIILGADEGHRVSFRIVYFNDISTTKTGDEQYNRLLRVFSGIESTDTESSLFAKVQQNNPDITDYKVVTFYSENPDPSGQHIINYNTITYNKKYMNNGVINTASWKVTQNALMRVFNLVGINQNIVLDEKELKAIATKDDNNRKLIFAWIGFAVAIAATVVASVFTFGAAATVTPALAAAGAAIAGFAGITTLSGLAAVSAASVACAAIALGSGASAAALQVESKTKEWQKSILSKGWFELGEAKEKLDDAYSRYTPNALLLSWFNNFPLQRIFLPTDFAVAGSHPKVKFYANIACLTQQKDQYKDAEEKFNQYYIDNSIVTFNSPELENNQDIIDNSDGLDFRIIGTIPINANYGSYLINTDNAGLSTSSAVIYGEQFGSSINGSSTFIQENNNSLQCGFLYQDNKFIPSASTDIIASDSVDAYKVFLWNRDTSISLGSASGITYNASANNPLTRPIANLGRKVFANQLYSIGTNYFDNDYYWSPSNGIDSPQIFNSDNITVKQFNHYSDKKFYYGNYDHIVSYNENNYYRPLSKTLTEESFVGINNWKIYDPVHIKYKNTIHAIVKFKPNDNVQDILPVINDVEYSIDYFSNDEIFGDNKIDKRYSYDIIGYDNSSYINNIQVLGDKNDGGPIDIPTQVLNRSEYDGNIHIDFPMSGLYISICQNSDALNPEDKANINDIIKTYNLGVVIAADGFGTEMFYFDRIENGRYYGYHSVDGINGSFKQVYLNKNASAIGVVLDGCILDIEDSAYVGKRNISTTFKEDDLSENNVSSTGTPYLYMAELYKKNFDPKNIYGGIESNQLQRISWIPCSGINPINGNVNITWGDSYYQRWDCLKSYPYTEEDTNSIVDICSCMIESHINLDGRCDVNRGIQNIVNARPTNWNLYNDAYNQQDNLFKYNILDDKHNIDIYPNQIAWSLTKSPTETIDTWTNINMANVLNLDGRYGKVNKVININDTIVAFQDKAIASIMFNDRHQITTTSGVPIEIANSGKVDGYNYITTNYGCHNKWSIVKAASGIYFIDDLNKSFMSYSKDGLSDISANGFINWFKENVNGEIWAPTISRNTAFKNAYDSITNDIYIINNDICLLFNEKIGTFTSFMDYKNVPMWINMKGNSYSLNEEDGNCSLYKMFAGEYNVGYNNNYTPYEIQYKINPEPYIDKTFTNVEFIADCLSPSVKIDNPYGDNNLITDRPFNELKVWNEYQYGYSDMKMSQTPSDLKRKFRIFRNEIPRDENSAHKLDRIRNPWIYLSLKRNLSNIENADFKMVFHNATVKYFK